MAQHGSVLATSLLGLERFIALKIQSSQEGVGSSPTSGTVCYVRLYDDWTLIGLVAN